MADKLKDLEKRLAEDRAKLEALQEAMRRDAVAAELLELNLANLSPDLAAMLAWLEAEEAEWEAYRAGNKLESGSLDRISTNIVNASVDQAALLDVAETGDDDKIESLLRVLLEKRKRYLADRAQTAAPLAAWGKTIRPSGPPRDEWEQAADINRGDHLMTEVGDIDDDPVGEYKPKPAGDFTNLLGNLGVVPTIGLGVGLFFVVRQVMK